MMCVGWLFPSDTFEGLYSSAALLHLMSRLLFHSKAVMHVSLSTIPFNGDILPAIDLLTGLLVIGTCY